MSSGARIIEADRVQLRWDMVDLDSQLATDHLARVVWNFVNGLDLSRLYARVRARDDRPGRPAADPKVLLAVWLYGTLDGIGSARALERLCETHTAYRWLCGGVPVNYHGLSDFRSGHAEVLDGILTQSVAVLLAAGLVRLDEVAVDGTKVRAQASRKSFRGEKGLLHYEAEASARVQRLKAELESDSGASEQRRRAAQARAAEQVAQQAAAARAKLAELQKEKAKRAEKHKKAEAAKKDPKASTSDPEARIMKFSDGAHRAAYNMMIACDPASLVVLSIRPTDRRNDTGMLVPMIDDVAARYGRRPARCLADGGMATEAEILTLGQHPAGQTEVYAPVPQPREGTKPENVKKQERKLAKAPEPLQNWRARMATDDGKALYKNRWRIEAVNAQLKNRGCWRFLLRGMAKVKCEALLAAIAHNLVRGHALRSA